MQFNKRDLPNVLSEAEMQERWSAAPWPLVMASALTGAGVQETFVKLVEAVYPILDKNFSLRETHGTDLTAFVSSVVGGQFGNPG